MNDARRKKATPYLRALYAEGFVSKSTILSAINLGARRVNAFLAGEDESLGAELGGPLEGIHYQVGPIHASGAYDLNKALSVIEAAGGGADISNAEMGAIASDEGLSTPTVRRILSHADHFVSACELAPRMYHNGTLALPEYVFELVGRFKIDPPPWISSSQEDCELPRYAPLVEAPQPESAGVEPVRTPAEASQRTTSRSDRLIRVSTRLSELGIPESRVMDFCKDAGAPGMDVSGEWWSSQVAFHDWLKDKFGLSLD